MACNCPAQAEVEPFRLFVGLTSLVGNDMDVLESWVYCKIFKTHCKLLEGCKQEHKSDQLLTSLSASKTHTHTLLG